MAFSATSLRRVQANGIKGYVGSFACSEGDSGTIVIDSPDPLSVSMWAAGDGTDFSPFAGQIAYSISTTTGRTTFTVVAGQTVTTGRYWISAL